jgi:ADP-ribose pyrophosphatase YjhB (NUDIX family)
MKTDARYSKTNPKVTAEDIVDHEAVAAVIRDKGMVLVFWHEKYNYFTLPVGKVKIGQSLRDALNEEIFEEIGIEVIQCQHLVTFNEDYSRGEDVITHTVQHIFEVTEYRGVIKNAEPEKHSMMGFSSVIDLWNMPVDKSDVLVEFLKLEMGRTP